MREPGTLLFQASFFFLLRRPHFFSSERDEQVGQRSSFPPSLFFLFSTRRRSIALHHVRRCSPLQQARRLLGERPLGGETLDFRSVDSFSVVVVVVVVASSSPCPFRLSACLLARDRSCSHAAGGTLHPGPAHGRLCDSSRSGSPRSRSRSRRWRRRPPAAEGPARFALAANGRQDCLLGHAGEIRFLSFVCVLC